MSEYDSHDYNRESIIKQLGLIELHGKDGSAYEAGCECIEGKHLVLLEALSEEGAGFGLTQKEKDFYLWLSDHARNIRKKIETENWSIPPPRAVHYLKQSGNPGHARSCQERRESCVKQLKGHPGIDNPYAVCNAAIKCS